MKTVTVKNVVLGEGIPKVCVPIVARSKEEIINEAKSFQHLPVEVVEWRADWFEDVRDSEKTIALLEELVEALNGIPLLYTIRTTNEGGECAISAADYQALNCAVAASGLIDLIDVEVFIGDQAVRAIIDSAHQAGIFVVASNHDFHKTPAKEDIIYRLRKMDDLGADILKIAVMPTCALDVLTLLEATTLTTENYTDKPVISMSMAAQGVISRLSCEAFGSCLTFGAAKKASAPGQMSVVDLAATLKLIHNSMGNA